MLDLMRAPIPSCMPFAGVYIAPPGLAVLIVSVVALSIWRVWLAPRVHSDEPGKLAGSLPPWPDPPEEESLNLELGVEPQCQEMPLADGADCGVLGWATLWW